MRSAALLTTWATTALAFYPFIPSYREGDDPTTYKLSQKASTRNDGLSTENADREARRLSRKYASKASRTSPGSETLVGRDNKYPVATAATPSGTNSVGVDQDGTDFSYFIEASLGSSSKSLYMLCDTGAGTTWVMGSDCGSTACTMHTTWGPSESTTSKAIGDGFSINYGTGSVKGSLTEDSMSIASVKVTMTLGVANTASNDFNNFAFDGILGLSMNKGETDNFMGSVKEDKLLKSNVFSVALDRAEDGPNTGELTFGGVDSNKFTGGITYTSVDASANGDWAIAMDNIGYDGNKAGVTGRLAYIDTGTTYAFGPSKDVAALHKVIPGASSSDGVTFTAPCDSDKSITVTFSGVDQKISVKDWLSEPSSSGVCTSNIYGREVVSGAWLLGAVYLKNVYTVFDIDQTRIGFASKAVATSTSTSKSSTSTSTTDSTATPSASASGTTGVAAGSSGHETSPGATAAAETSSTTTTSAAASPGKQLMLGTYTSMLFIAGVVAMMIQQ
ncbi:hypothetical protein J7T55_006262 [Diaporthe amygdali]|uniref:uncharacterized protein n=1 Tax=Phomopsis amygdali TaxID=1214568 RepID=UPI0022FE6EA1|nr:uncharacterized protein J7T55_006262 [Diaporthe amygdali]KAJ0124919.1 hypothetical protein J7T55_006262 [Diaporthe amygdali]